MVERFRPLSAPSAHREGLPFAAAALAAAATLGIPAGGGLAFWAALMMIGAVIAAAALLPWDRWPAWTESLPAFAFFVVVALLRHAEGGGTSGFAPVTALPILWLALYGSRRQMYAALVCTALVFVGPIVVLGPPVYPPSDWRRAALWVVNAALIGPAVQRLVGESRRRQVDLELIGTLMRSVARDGDVRSALCRAAQQSSGADFTMLFESPEPGVLRAVAAAGTDLSPVTVRLGDEPTAEAIAYVSRQPYFVAEMRGNATVTAGMVDATGARAGLFEPLRVGDRVLGVLVLCWRRPLPNLPERVGKLSGILAAEAASAIERDDLLERLDAQARTDALTGAANRRALDAELERERDRASRNGTALSVALLDVDHFKQFNDTFGHPAGDQLLRDLVAAVNEQLRSIDLVARYGGEEFALMLPNCAAAAAVDVAERVRAAVPHNQTCSVGVATWDGRETVEALLSRADRALYAAKRAGRNRVIAARPPHDDAPIFVLSS